MKRFCALLVLLASCHSHTGDLKEDCNKDGTCNSPELMCGIFGECHFKPMLETGPRRCSYESECFCVTCAEQCAPAGVKQCVYSDTSVWGAKPAVCECK